MDDVHRAGDASTATLQRDPQPSQHLARHPLALPPLRPQALLAPRGQGGPIRCRAGKGVNYCAFYPSSRSPCLSLDIASSKSCLICRAGKGVNYCGFYQFSRSQCLSLDSSKSCIICRAGKGVNYCGFYPFSRSPCLQCR